MKINFKIPLYNVILNLSRIVLEFSICDSEFFVQSYKDLEQDSRNDTPSIYRIEKLISSTRRVSYEASVGSFRRSGRAIK